MIILICGGTATGKSTLASVVAKELGITHVISTDFIREVVRQYVPRIRNPFLHKSTYAALESIADSPEMELEERARVGFLLQREVVVPSLRAILKRCYSEHRSLIIEGVHISPDCIVEGNELLLYFTSCSNRELTRRYELRKEAQPARLDRNSITELVNIAAMLGQFTENEFDDFEYTYKLKVGREETTEKSLEKVVETVNLLYGGGTGTWC